MRTLAGYVLMVFGVLLLLMVAGLGIGASPAQFLSVFGIAVLVFGAPGVMLLIWGRNLTRKPKAETLPVMVEPPTSAAPEFQPVKMPPAPPGWQPVHQGQPLPRPQAQGPGQPQIVYVPVYRALPEKPKRKSSNGAVGCLLLLIILGVLLWPQIQTAIKSDEARRGVAAVPGVISVIEIRYGEVETTGADFVIVTARVRASAMIESTAQAIWRSLVQDRPALQSFGAIFSDGERVFSYGYDRAPNTWSFTDMTGLVEP